MKKCFLAVMIVLAAALAGCQKKDVTNDNVKIELSNNVIMVNGEPISEDIHSPVYKANDIIFYLEDQGIAYGNGKKTDEHSQAEADAHTVVHITEAGVYEISGTMEAGQIFIDLGDGTKDEEDAVVTLVLNGADITCTVAPAILFYRTYECAGKVNKKNASMEVDTSTAGANIVLAEGSFNKVHGSYVAEIYESCELNEEKTEMIDSKRLHKYDGAVHSRRSLNITGTGALEVAAENEGICSEMHMTIQGGDIQIKSGNDGINTSKDKVSVFAMNGGNLEIQVTGETGEGDGIDSNGWLVVNDGTLRSYGCATSMDSGIDADKGIYINGGTVIASGNMKAELAAGKQDSVTFMIEERMEAGQNYQVKDENENLIMEAAPGNGFSVLVVSSKEISEEDSCSLWMNGNLVAESRR